MKEEETLVEFIGRWDIPYRHSAGHFLSRFLRELKDNKRIMGVKCSKCRRVLVPPRAFCERCFVRMEDWVEVKDEGTLESFTVNYAAYESLPKPPYCIAFVKLDGADTALMHHLSGIDLEDATKIKERIVIGMRVKAVWRKEREGSILDIQHFVPVQRLSRKGV